MKIFYILDCCCRVVVLAVILPLKLSFITFGLRPFWLLQSFGLIQQTGELNETTPGINRNEWPHWNEETPGKNARKEWACFLIDNIEFGLNCGVVFFVLLEYSVR